MIKPFWALAGVALLGTAGVAGAVIVASSGGEEEFVQTQETASPDESPTSIASETPATTTDATPGPPAKSCDPEATPPPGTKLWRWLDVTVALPEGEGFRSFPQGISPESKPPNGGPGLNIVTYNPSDGSVLSSVLIDAETGALVRQDVRPEDEASMQQVKSTVAVCPFDPAAAPWPYNGEPPANATREAWFGMSFLRPDPATGIIVEFSIGSGGSRGGRTPAECEIGGESVSASNGKSTAFVWVDANTGAMCKDVSYVQPADSVAFERYLADVKRCDKDIKC